MKRVLILCDRPKHLAGLLRECVDRFYIKSIRPFYRPYIYWENTKTEKDVAMIIFGVSVTYLFIQEARGKKDKNFVDCIIDIRENEQLTEEERQSMYREADRSADPERVAEEHIKRMLINLERGRVIC